jgi:hypothetical protein
MVARIQKSAGLIVTFSRNGEEIDSRVGSTGERAQRIALLMIARLDDLQAGDKLTVIDESIGTSSR